MAAEYPNTQDDWPTNLKESASVSQDVMAICENENKPFKAWFNFNYMLWYSYTGKIAHKEFKWRELYNFEK